eukprot:COSAG05_NODE_27085_length_168_cov_52.202899_1_plen_44_part_10
MPYYRVQALFIAGVRPNRRGGVLGCAVRVKIQADCKSGNTRSVL